MSTAQRLALRLTRARLVGLVLVVALLVAMALDTTWFPVGKDIPGQQKAFDATAYAQEQYDATIVPAITDGAVDLAVLAPELAQDLDAAGEQYGSRDGSSPYTFPVSFEGVAGKPEGGLLPVRVPGLPPEVRVSVQIGPAVNGTALRDVTGTVKFNDFVNQVEYADAALALNDQMRSSVLADLDRTSLAGSTVTVIGATAPLNPELITVTPVSLEVTP